MTENIKKPDDQDLLVAMGIDGLKWAEAYTSFYENSILSFPDTKDRENFVAWMCGWFSNAILVGMRAELKRIEKLEGKKIPQGTENEYE